MTAESAGETAIMARTLGRAAATPIIVVKDRPLKNYPQIPENNYIDRLSSQSYGRSISPFGSGNRRRIPAARLSRHGGHAAHHRRVPGFHEFERGGLLDCTLLNY